jgi:hypothetical protein
MAASQACAASAVKGTEGILALRRPARRSGDGWHDLGGIRIADGCGKEAFKDAYDGSSVPAYSATM